MDLVKDEYYCVELKDRILIFKFDGTYNNGKPNYYYLYHNMNSHWDNDNVVFIRPDGSNSYPYEFRLADKKSRLSFVTIRDRKIRPATTREIFLIESCHKLNTAITIEEFRDILLNEILG